jgi:FkbM family methyltransferase
VAELVEDVVAENRRLRRELKSLEARARAIEASRWWRLHPRLVTRRLRGQHATPRPPVTSHAKVTRLARQWRLRAQHEQRNSGCESDEIVVRDGLRLKIHPASRGTFDVFCYWSPEGVDELDSFIANTSDRRRLLDVGASHGIFSLVFAAGHPEREVLAVDASPLAFATLLYNIRKNGASNIVVEECALSNASGELEMHYYGEYAVAGGDGSLRVASRTGDALCEGRSFEPDVVKIDVEGHELRVLEGLRETIARNRPLLFLELHPALMPTPMAEVARVLRQLGYGTAELRGRRVPVEQLAGVDEVERVLLRPDQA